jgi:hypothetical protein
LSAHLTTLCGTITGLIDAPSVVSTYTYTRSSFLSTSPVIKIILCKTSTLNIL